MSKQTAVRLPDKLHSRLQALAARTGRTATYYIREAIEEHLDDLEDLYLAETVSRRLKDGKSKSRTLDEVEGEVETWKAENSGALTSSNEWVDANGLPLDQHRQF